jgi:hypothetical protein
MRASLLASAIASMLAETTSATVVLPDLVKRAELRAWLYDPVAPLQNRLMSFKDFLFHRSHRSSS